ncbi:biotin--[acetyl-CoA-carboxylase] ligase [Cupriavidus sp. SW-Y-13]|uniref:biotin--[acetyl-CoA-carboxylase] ligase n=1 Tax=Cupriavidus sp. SW-Y-13 TaxID=2653854 RepID=UPI00136560C6|nr:biotin--[acetyl-CoA-carboxylase] ligase [Cupriavidus sp. SW-Y-13]MWL85902.1 biotin--[acetyl-CoA-carboxylase] ligase [Cupriavidus sp. SW-Y-13]
MPDRSTSTPISALTDDAAALPAWHIDESVLRRTLDGGAARDWQVDVVAETGSTNADLTQACRSATWDDARAQVRVAYRQTAGRGRQGRPWQGQAGLTFSVAMPLALAPARLSGLSLAVGLAVAQALEDCGAATAVGLKWPNDLQVDGRKLAGILIESVPAGPQRLWAVIGIGLNLVRDARMEAALGRDLSGVAEVLPTFDPHRDPTRILGAVLNRLAAMREVFLAEGFAALAPAWSARDAFRNEPVRLLHDGTVVAEGLARGVDGEGHLLLETANGLEPITSGEVSLRGAPA